MRARNHRRVPAAGLAADPIRAGRLEEARLAAGRTRQGAGQAARPSPEGQEVRRAEDRQNREARAARPVGDRRSLADQEVHRAADRRTPARREAGPEADRMDPAAAVAAQAAGRREAARPNRGAVPQAAGHRSQVAAHPGRAVVLLLVAAHHTKHRICSWAGWRFRTAGTGPCINLQKRHRAHVRQRGDGEHTRFRPHE